MKFGNVIMAVHSSSDNKRTDGPFSTERTVRSLIFTTTQGSPLTWTPVRVTPQLQWQLQIVTLTNFPFSH